jgi:hypothetical protein
MPGFDPTPDAKTFGSAEGEVVLWFPVDGVAAARITGHIHGDVASAVFGEIDRVAQAREHPARGFADFSEMTDFDWEAKGVLLRWNIAHRHQASRFDVLSGSWITHATITALGTILRHRLVSHASRTTFDAAYAVMLRNSSGRLRRSRLSSPP